MESTKFYDGMNDDIMCSPDSGEHDEDIAKSIVASKSEMLSEQEYDVKSYFGNMNYWNNTDHNWNNILSSGIFTTNIKDHLDTKAQIPTKDIDIIVNKKAPHVNDDYSNFGGVPIGSTMEYRYMLMMMGMNLEHSALLLGDNNSVVLNTTMPSSVLKKKHCAVSYHKVRETIAAGIVRFSHIQSELNYADILTKPLGPSKFMELVKPLLFCNLPED